MSGNDAVIKAKENYDKLSADEETQKLAKKRELFLITQEQLFNSGMQQGLKEGVEQGIKQGVKQGVKQGIEQGEKSKALKIAKKLLSKGTSVNEIIDITGLAKDEIIALKD